MLMTKHREIVAIIRSSVDYTKKRDCNNRQYRDDFAKLHDLLLLSFWPGPTADHHIALDPTSRGRRPIPFNEYRFTVMSGKILRSFELTFHWNDNFTFLTSFVRLRCRVRRGHLECACSRVRDNRSWNRRTAKERCNG